MKLYYTFVRPRVEYCGESGTGWLGHVFYCLMFVNLFKVYVDILFKE